MTNRMRAESDILVLGVGNLLCADDGVGAEVIRRLSANPPPGAVLAEVGTATLHAISFLETARRALVIDAVKAGGIPGTIYELDLEQAAARDWRASLHALGLREAMRALAPDRPPPPIQVLGVEPLTLEYGIGLSAPVEAAVPHLIKLARRWIARQQASLAAQAKAPGASAAPAETMIQPAA